LEHFKLVMFLGSRTGTPGMPVARAGGAGAGESH
jgi:hypothetical protein